MGKDRGVKKAAELRELAQLLRSEEISSTLQTVPFSLEEWDSSPGEILEEGEDTDQQELSEPEA